MSIFVPLFEILPKLARQETKAVSFGGFFSNKKFHFHEMFCSEHGCDCRKAMIRVVDNKGELVATLSYGWEPVSYYAKEKFSSEYLEAMSGVSLEVGAPQSKRANEAKALF